MGRHSSTSGTSGTSGTATADSAVELAHLIRQDFVESRFIGSAVTLDAHGHVVAKLGDPDADIYPRSTLKPFQAIASLRRGAQLTTPQLALACGSHLGSEYHQSIAASTLTASGHNASSLQCPPSWPSQPQETARMAADIAPLIMGPRRLAHNCSGKHAAFIAACVASGDPVETYTQQEHPLQREVIEVLAEYTGRTVTHLAGDGCGAPAPVMSLADLARGYHRLGHSLQSRDTEWAAITAARAMLDEPEAVHGPGMHDTVILEKLQWLAKAGAEGVVAVAAPDGTATCVKMLSGSVRAAHTVAVLLTAQFTQHRPETETLTQVLQKTSPTVTSAGETVGRLRLAPPTLRVLGAHGRR